MGSGQQSGWAFNTNQTKPAHAATKKEKNLMRGTRLPPFLSQRSSTLNALSLPCSSHSVCVSLYNIHSDSVSFSLTLLYSTSHSLLFSFHGFSFSLHFNQIAITNLTAQSPTRSLHSRFRITPKKKNKTNSLKNTGSVLYFTSTIMNKEKFMNSRLTTTTQ